MSDIVIYTSPRACSTACHLALEESGIDYAFELVRIRRGENRLPAYLEINPAGKVPALKTGEGVLTETPAILLRIADLARPGKTLVPAPPDGLYRALEWMSFLTSTVHLAFRPLFRPQQFTDDESLFPAVREKGGSLLRDTLLEVERRLAGTGWALDDSYSVVDPYLLVFHIWSQRDDIRPYVAEMPNWDAHRQRIEDRPATWCVLAREGITPENITDP